MTRPTMRLYARFSLLALAFTLASCSSPRAAPPGGEPGTWCDLLSLTADSGEPGGRVGINGLPDNHPVLYARVTAPGATEPSLALVERRPEGGDALIVPVHPVDALSGGAITLTFTDGAVACAPQPFEVGAMADPDAPEVQGTLTRQAAALQATIDVQAQAQGINPDLLKGDLSTLPPAAAPLAMAQFIVEHPQNPNSLAEIARRGSVLSEGEFVPFDTKLMDLLAYEFAFSETLQPRRGEPLQTAALADDCTGPPALASAQHLNDCMKRGQQLQEFYDALSLQADQVTTTLAPLVIAFPALGTPLLVLGYTYYFMNAVLMLESAASPRALASLEFTATPTAFENDRQSGRWGDVRVTVADGEPFNIAELIVGLIENAGLGQFLPGLGAAGDALRRLFEYQFEVVAALVLENLEKAYGDRLNVPFVPYSTFGAVDITEYRESYSASVVGGTELRVVSHAQRTYAPSVPFANGRVDLVLAVNPGYFNDSPVEGAQGITIGNPTGADGPFSITRIEAPPIPWNGRGEVKIHWSGEAVTFPVTFEVTVADCSEFTGCDLIGYEFAARANPLVYPIGCTSNQINPPPSQARVEISLEDSRGKLAAPRQAVFQCGAPGTTQAHPQAGEGRTLILLRPER